jgi:hypothetical protein
MSAAIGGIVGGAVGAGIGLGLGYYVKGGPKWSKFVFGTGMGPIAVGAWAAAGVAVGATVGHEMAKKSLPAQTSSAPPSGGTTGGTGPQTGGSVVQLVPDSQNSAQTASAPVGSAITILPPTTGTWSVVSAFPPPGFTASGTAPTSILVNISAAAPASGTVQWIQIDPSSGQPLSPTVTATVQVSAQ